MVRNTFVNGPLKRPSRLLDQTHTNHRTGQDISNRCWPGEGTKVYLQLRYGNKPLEVKKGKPAIELADIEALLPTLHQIREAIVAGEFDTVLMAAKKERAMSWKKGKK